MTPMKQTAQWLVVAALPLLSVMAASAEEPAKRASERRWSLEVGLADARHPGWQFPIDPLMGSLRYKPQTVATPHETWGTRMSLSFRLPGRAGRLTASSFLENIGDGVFEGSKGVAVPYERSDGSWGSLLVYSNASIQPKASYALSWSRAFLTRGSRVLQHELGLVTHRPEYGNSLSSGGGTFSNTSQWGVRLGLVATQRLAAGAAADLVVGCTAARSRERFGSSLPLYTASHHGYSTQEETRTSFRLVPDVTLRLRLPLSRRLEATGGYRWERYGRMNMGTAETWGAFAGITVGIGN
jgi:hypothetical protein